MAKAPKRKPGVEISFDEYKTFTISNLSKPIKPIKGSTFTGVDTHYGGSTDHKDYQTYKDGHGQDREYQHATQWYNMRPICPYGCGEEGELVEIVLKDGKALGIYRDSEQLKFTADLQMAPKPTGRKIKIGPDGEPHYEEETEIE